jgi:hypothetical protein
MLLPVQRQQLNPSLDLIGAIDSFVSDKGATPC